MGIREWWAAARRKRFADRATSIGLRIQLSLYEYCEKELNKHVDPERATKIAACIANFVFHFGLISPQHAEDPHLVRAAETQRKRLLPALGDKFKSNATGVLILLAAVKRMELARFLLHMELLASEGFAKVGGETPNVARELPVADLVYMYEVASMGTDEM